MSDYPVFVVDTEENSEWIKETPGYSDELSLFEKVKASPKKVKGGPGSGNFGHAGRPGRVGGSQPNKNGSGIPAAFKGDRERFEDALKFFGGEDPKEWYGIAYLMSGELRKGPDSQYKPDFTNDDMQKKYFVKPTTPDGKTDYEKWGEAWDAQQHKWTLTREEYTAIRDIIQKRGEERIDQLRKEIGFPEDVKDLLGEGIFDPDLNIYDYSRSEGAKRQTMDEMLKKSDILGREVIQKVGLENYSRTELRMGLMDYYEKQLPESPEGEYSPGRKWLDNIERSIEGAGEFETMHLLSRGDWDYEYANKWGFHVEGRDSEWKELPKEMWHVTTASDALVREGIKSRFELGMFQGPGLGGGSDKTASVSTDLKTAKEIERTMQEASMVINGEITVKKLIDLAVEGAGGVGRNWAWEAIKSESDKRENIRDYDPYNDTDSFYHNQTVRKLLDYEAGRKVTDWRGKNVWDDEKYLEEKWHFYAGNYMWARERVGGFMNPLFFSTDYKKLGKLDPKQFKTHQYAPANPRCRGWQCSSLAEWRIVGSDVVKLKKVIDFYDPDDPDFLQKVLYGG